jgi:hypothetical protein
MNPALHFRGCVSTLESTAVSNFIYFYTFHGLKQLVEARGQNPLQDLLFACVAGSSIIVGCLSTHEIKNNFFQKFFDS